jgi:hypothetical protein
MQLARLEPEPPRKGMFSIFKSAKTGVTQGDRHEQANLAG